MADQFAAKGYYTIIPDLFKGDALPLNFKNADLPGWLINHPSEAVDAIVEKAIKYLKEEKGIKNIGAVGYCFVGFSFHG